jgi:HK97 family phage prohead protease
MPLVHGRYPVYAVSQVAAGGSAGNGLINGPIRSNLELTQFFGLGAQVDTASLGGTTSGTFISTTLSMRPDVQLLLNHEGLPLARTTISPGQVGHLALSEDSRGLHFLAQLDRDDGDAQKVMRKVGAGLMDQCSFAFRTIHQTWNDDRSLRTINDVSLDRGDVSIVNYGASPTTSVDARALGRQAKESNLSLYQARVRASTLKGAAATRTRHIVIMNNAGRQR